MGDEPPGRKHMSFVVLKNGVSICATRTFDTIEEAIDMVRMLERGINRLVEHSPYTITTYAAYMEGK
jgi:hypothetical protein